MGENKGGPRVMHAAVEEDTATHSLPSEPTDEELALRLLDRDGTAAYDMLVRRYHRRVWGHCCRMVGSSPEAEDLVQETFLRLHRYRDRYQAGGNFRAWLDRICINVCLTHLEQSRKQPVVHDTSTASAPVGSAEAQRQDPEGRARITEILDRVQQALETIPAAYRAALVLRAFGELSYPEIARALGCSEGTVMSRLSRAREQLRNRLRSLR